MAETQRANNFDVLRLLAAFMVLAGHQSFISGNNSPLILMGVPIHTFGVYIFFLIGGYLISKSWKSDPHVLRYACKRFFRIWPPMLVFCIVAAVTGGMLTWLTPKEYIHHSMLWGYFNNLIFRVRYALPGVFEGNPYPNAVNGSLWTLPVEVAMYILLPIILSVGKGKLLPKILALVLCFAQILHLKFDPARRIIFYDTDLMQALAIVPYYLIGVVYTDPKIKKVLNVQVAVCLILLMSCMKFGIVSGLIAQYVTIPYVVFSLALAPNPKFSGVFSKCECSYGMYLYGFFVQQLVALASMQLGLQLAEWKTLLIATVITFGIAMLSFRFVEKPCIKLGKKLTRMLRTQNGAEKASI